MSLLAVQKFYLKVILVAFFSVVFMLTLVCLPTIPLLVLEGFASSLPKDTHALVCPALSSSFVH